MNMFQNMRCVARMTQEELARQLRVDRSTIAKWETGQSKPRAETLLKLAQILNCTVDELLRDPEEKAPVNG